jgi:hypothetical protein
LNNFQLFFCGGLSLMYQIIENSTLWRMFYETTEHLNFIYNQLHSTQQTTHAPLSIHLNLNRQIPELINQFNTSGFYIYKSIPQYKFSFLSYYLLKALRGGKPDLVGFLHFLLKNGANLDGIAVIKDHLIRTAFIEQSHFEFLTYLFETQQFKLDEPLALISYNQTHKAKLLEILDLDKKLITIDEQFRKGTVTPDNELLLTHSDGNYSDEFFFQAHSIVYFPFKKSFLYFDFSARLRVSMECSVPEMVLQGTSNMGKLFKQEELIATKGQIATLEALVQQEFVKLPHHDHPIHYVHKYPNSAFSTYFLERCHTITRAEETPLMVAVRFGAYKLMHYLLQNKRVDIDSRNNRQEDALTIAIQQGDITAIAILLEFKPSVLSQQSTTLKYTVFHIATIYQRKNVLHALATVAQSTPEKLGHLWANESNTLFHWIAQKQLLPPQEQIIFLEHCDTKDKEDAYAKKMERIIYNLLCLAYTKSDKESVDRLLSYLSERQGYKDIASLIIKVITVTSLLKITNDGFCDGAELQSYIELLLVGMLPSELAPEVSKLALFACRQNKPRIAHHLITSFDAKLSTELPADTNLLHECLASRAYESALWLIKNQDGCPRHGLTDVHSFIVQEQCLEGHYGHQLIHDQQIELLLLLLSLGCFDQLLGIVDHKGNTMLDIVLTLRIGSLISALITRIQELIFVPNKPSLARFHDTKEKQALLKYFRQDQIEGLITKNSLIQGQTLAQFAYTCFGHDINQFISIVNELELYVNQVDSEGRTLLQDLLDELLNGTLSLKDLLECIKRLKFKLTDVDPQQSGLLIWACEHEHVALASECIKNKNWQQHNVLQFRPTDGLSALDSAYSKKNDALFRLLWKQISADKQVQLINELKGNQRSEENRARLSYLIELKITYIKTKNKNKGTKKEEPNNSSSTSFVFSPSLSPISFEQIEEETPEVIPEKVIEDSPELKAYKQICSTIEKGSINDIKELKTTTDVMKIDLLNQHGLVFLEQAIQANRPPVLNQLLRISRLHTLALESIEELLIKTYQSSDKQEIANCLLNKFPAIKERLCLDPMARKRFASLNQVAYPESIALYKKLPITKDYVNELCTQRDMQAILALATAEACSNQELKLFDNVVYQEAILREDYELLNELLLDFCTDYRIPNTNELLRPLCYLKNSYWRPILRELSALFQELAIEAVLYGSSMYTEDPNDLDIHIKLSTYRHEEIPKLNALIAELTKNSGPVIRDKNGLWGYEKPLLGRIIPVIWKNISLELVLTTLTCEQHAKNRVDITLGAMYFKLNTFNMEFVEGIDACADLHQRIIRTIHPSYNACIQDPKIIFRAVRLKAKHHFSFADEYSAALALIAKERGNLFSAMKPDVLCHQLKLVLEAKSSEHNIEELRSLKLLDKISEAFLNAPRQGLLAQKIKPAFLSLIEPYRKKPDSASPTQARKIPNVQQQNQRFFRTDSIDQSHLTGNKWPGIQNKR